MNSNDFKIMILNTSALALSFADIENFLKIVLLSVSIVYTVYKTLELHKNYKSDKKKKDD